MYAHSTVLFSKNDIEGVLSDFKTAVNIVEKSFMEYKSGQVILPEKISQIFDEATQNRINCMPASLLKENVSGVKWISVFPNNPQKNIDNVSGLIILSEIEHGLPIAVMDAAFITAVRTAAVGACAVKYLANKSAETIGFIGAGKQAKYHFAAIKTILPGLKKCCISSRSCDSVERFSHFVKLFFPEMNIVNCGNCFEDAIVNADIIVTATSTQAPLLKASWIKSGATYIHVGGWEDEYAVAKKADKIICDQWNAVKHRGQTICRMYKEGLLSDDDIYADFAYIIDGEKPGRENDKEIIYFNSVGLSFIDIYFAKYVYDQLKNSDHRSFVF